MARLAAPIVVLVGSLVTLPVAARIATSVVVEVIQQHGPQLSRCYDAALARAAEPSFRMTLDIRIAADGHVEAVGIDAGTSADALMQDCVIASVRTWTFPPSGRGPISIRYPLVFAPH